MRIWHIERTSNARCERLAKYAPVKHIVKNTSNVNSESLNGVASRYKRGREAGDEHDLVVHAGEIKHGLLMEGKMH